MAFGDSSEAASQSSKPPQCSCGSRETRNAASGESNNTNEHRDIPNDNPSNFATTERSSGHPQPQPSGGLFGGSQSQQSSSGFGSGSNVQNNATADRTGCVPSTGSQGLFGSTSHNPPSISGSLFGARPTQTNTSGDLFGGSQPSNTSGSLFGGSNPTQSQPQSSCGLFGRQSNPPTGGLFGNLNQLQPLGGSSADPRPNYTAGGPFWQPQSGCLDQITNNPLNNHPGFGSTQFSCGTGRPFEYWSPQPSTNIFGQTANGTTNGHGLFGNRPAQSQTTTGGFGSTTNNAPSSQVFGGGQAPTPASSCTLSGRPTNNTTRADSHQTGLFGQSQAQNRPSNVFGQTNHPSTFASNTCIGGFATPTTTWANLYKPVTAQSDSRVSPFCGFESRSNKSDFKSDNNLYRMGTGKKPYTPFSERDPNGHTNLYNHISFGEPYRSWSTEELRLTDYENGLRFGDPRLQKLFIEPPTNYSQNPSAYLPPKQAHISLGQSFPASELERLSRQVASQQLEIAALRMRLDHRERVELQPAIYNDQQSASNTPRDKSFARPGSSASVKVPWDEGAKTCLAGLSLVFTGRLPSISRNEAVNLVEKYGAKVTLQPSLKTNFIVLGQDVDPKKLETIKILGLKTIDEDQLFLLIRNLPANGGEEEDPKNEADLKEKRRADAMASLMYITEKRQDLADKLTEILKQRQENCDAALLSKLNINSGSTSNTKDGKEVDNEEENSATSTPVNILTPTSSTATSQSSTPAPTTTTTKLNQPNTTPITTTNTTTNPPSPLCCNASRSLLAHLKTIYPYTSPYTSIRLWKDPELPKHLGLALEEFAHAAIELEKVGLTWFDWEAECYRWVVREV